MKQSISDVMAEEEKVALSDELEKQFEELTKGCEEVLPLNEFRQKLRESHENNRPLIIKAGFDPTAPDLHLGHTVLLQKLRLFQKFGHSVQFLIGDYTALIGDPTGKSETRKQLSEDEVKQNAKTYKEQVFRILDEDKTDVVFNSTWLTAMSLQDVLKLTGSMTVARMLERDDFSKRYKAGKSISIVEFMYPLMQGYDSVAMKADIELGGTDQKFNLLVGRDLQVQHSMPPQAVMTLPLLVGLDGEKKMSKSLNNYVGIQEKPVDIFGKLMSISDELMWEYYRLLSDLTIEQLNNLKERVSSGELHPKEAKARLASEITERFHDREAALTARSEWEKVHAPDKRGLPDDIKEYQTTEADAGILSVLKNSGIMSSNGEARRLIQGKGLHLVSDEGETTIEDPSWQLAKGEFIFRVGKRRFIKVNVK